MPLRLAHRLSPAWVFSALSATLSAGYGVLFTIVGDYRDTYGISASQIGVVIGLGFLSAFVSQILIAPAADRGYARRLIVAGVAAHVAGLLLMGFGETLTPILMGRLLSGIGIGTARPAIRRIVILAEPDKLGENLGRLLSADVFGFALGPAISAVLVGPLGLAAPFVVVAVVSAACIPLALGVEVTETADAGHQRLALDLLRSRAVAGAVVFGAAVFLMIGAFGALWDVVHTDLETSTWMANLGITLFAAPLVVLGPTGGRFAQRVGPYTVAALGLVIGAAFMVSYGQLPTGSWIFGFAMAHSICDSLTVSSSGVAMAMSVPEHRQAGAQGVLGAVQALTGGITAIIVGDLYDGPGRAAAYGATGVGMVLFVVVGIVLSHGSIVAERHRHRHAPAPQVV
ncbi:MAG: MFS transporter [Acidimicrobiales bacterium]